MLLSLLFRNVTGGMGLPTQLGALTIDVTVNEQHSFISEPTEFPIEGGSTISDNVKLLPRMLRIEGFVTDTPLVARGVSLGRSRSASAFMMLETMFTLRIPFIVVSQLRIYRNMVIKDLTVPKTAESALRFTCNMQELTFVTGQNVLIPGGGGGGVGGGGGGGAGSLSADNVANPAANAVGVDAGRQVGEEASEAVANSGSVLYNLSRRLF